MPGPCTKCNKLIPTGLARHQRLVPRFQEGQICSRSIFIPCCTLVVDLVDKRSGLYLLLVSDGSVVVSVSATINARTSSNSLTALRALRSFSGTVACANGTSAISRLIVSCSSGLRAPVRGL